MSSDHAQLIVPEAFNGPPGSANGGWFSGALAQHVPGAEAVTVTLRQPPPLGTPMDVVRQPDGSVRLMHGELLVGEAAPGRFAGLGTPEPVTFEEAKSASTRFRGHGRHPFPGCLVCGTGREGRPGLHLWTGPTDADATLHAGTWTPEPGLSGPEFVWASLDCPGAWTVDLENREVVLARITARVLGVPEAGTPCVVTARLIAQDGRKFTTVTALYTAEGTLLGEAEALWIELRR